LAAIVLQYQQPVEQSERECRNHEQVHRRDAVGVIIKEQVEFDGLKARLLGGAPSP
jgi:hypothetical protein